MGTYIILALLLVAIFFALKNSIGHFKGEGGCCGGGDTVSSLNKQLSQILDTRQVSIEGIHCQNCRNRIQNAINNISYLSCHFDYDSVAIIDSSQMIKEAEIIQIIEKEGYKVISLS